MTVIRYKTSEGLRYRAKFVRQGKQITKAGFKRQKDAKDWIADERRRLDKETPTSGGFSGLADTDT